MKNNLLAENFNYTGEHTAGTSMKVCFYNSGNVHITEEGTSEDVTMPVLEDGIKWIHFEGLSDEMKIREVCSAFNIEVLVLQDILNVRHPSKVEDRERYNFVITKMFTPHGAGQIGIIQGNGFVLSFSEWQCSIFEDIVKAIKDNAFKIRSRQSDHLLTVILNGIIANHLNEINRIDSELETIESELLSESTSKSIGLRIQSLRREYLAVKQTVYPLKEQYPKLLKNGSPLIQKCEKAFFSDVNDHIVNVAQKVEICRETLASLVDIYISNNDMRMNSIMKQLTIVSTIFIPLTFLAGIWGMNFKNMPELDFEWGYPIAWSIMITIGIIVYLLLRMKKWN